MSRRITGDRLYSRDNNIYSWLLHDVIFILDKKKLIFGEVYLVNLGSDKTIKDRAKIEVEKHYPDSKITEIEVGSPKSYKKWTDLPTVWFKLLDIN